MTLICISRGVDDGIGLLYAPAVHGVDRLIFRAGKPFLYKGSVLIMEHLYKSGTELTVG